jgi:hypothetical protein
MAQKPGIPATNPPPTRRRIRWTSAITVFSAATLIAAEVFGAAFAGGWALANLLDLNSYFGEWGTHGLQILFFALGFYVMALFIRGACRVEPIIVAE